MRLQINNMTSLHSKLIVKEELRNLGLHYILLGLGTVELDGEVTENQLESLKKNLLRSGLQLQNDKRDILIERIKDIITEMIDYSEEVPKTNYSDYISSKLNYDYTYLSNMFSTVKGITIQHFIIVHKIEKVKALLLNDELNLTEISYKLHYSSLAHLSNQFKKVTGLSPSFYKQMNQKVVQRSQVTYA
ncbi:MAG TPA: AraC family transcriptional regulator [Cyclobacteriaceae bacterium]|jgi:AraC-like DNA-binding protein|nr:AraC family transcriptional regulator [Cyclobacteriaceae bacterium]